MIIYIFTFNNTYYNIQNFIDVSSVHMLNVCIKALFPVQCAFIIQHFARIVCMVYVETSTFVFMLVIIFVLNKNPVFTCRLRKVMDEQLLKFIFYNFVF